MIDYVACVIPYTGPSIGDLYLRQDQETGDVTPLWNRARQSRGSYDSGMSVQVIGREMTLVGNPVKYLSGQNVVGTDDLAFLIRCTFDRVLDDLNLPDCLLARRAINAGNIELRRVDCTYHYKVGDDDDVRLWLQAMSQSCTVSHRGPGILDEGMASLMFGVREAKEGKKRLKGSTLSSFKFYNKHTELKKNKPSCHPKYRDAITEMAYGIVRAEALYRKPELIKQAKAFLRDWDKETPWELHRKWIEKMTISENVPVRSTKFKQLPNPLKSTYRLWETGENLLDCMSIATFKRHRKQLKDLLNIDIKLVRSKEEMNDQVRIIPVLRVLEASPVHVQEGEELFYQMLQAA